MRPDMRTGLCAVARHRGESRRRKTARASGCQLHHKSTASSSSREIRGGNGARLAYLLINGSVTPTPIFVRQRSREPAGSAGKRGTARHPDRSCAVTEPSTTVSSRVRPKRRNYAFVCYLRLSPDRDPTGLLESPKPSAR